jgi:aerobic carbon-monoxide dehydrogenase large subunit
VMGAVVDALAPLGVPGLDMPATPERVWQAIHDAQRTPSPPPHAVTPSRA